PARSLARRSRPASPAPGAGLCCHGLVVSTGGRDLLMRRVPVALALGLACWLSPSAARAAAASAPPSDVAGVIRRYLEVTGGAAAFAAESTSYTHAKLYAFGFEGSFSSWSARPARRYSRTELGPFKLSEGVNGTTAWRTDPTTGVIRPL